MRLRPRGGRGDNRDQLSRLARRVARSLYVGFGAAVIAAVMGALWVAMVIVRHTATAIALQSVASRLMLAALGCRYVVRGTWPPRDGRARVYVANHTSYLDIPLMLAALRRDFAFVTKDELLQWPVIGRVTRTGRHIPLDRARAESRGAVVTRMVKTLRAGRSVLVFPEGTFSLDAGLRPFHRGAFHAAAATGCEAVPIATRGVGKVWPESEKFPRPGRVELVVGDPLGGGEGADVEALKDAAERFISDEAGLPTAADRASATDGEISRQDA
jgi:1-acyl-sn-glycerol-3-phosphate acyltransferase